ncbi:hypothetical protein [Marinobacterium sp. MBR-109]|jgi:hypothetical protein|uniref:hypothetical protein n=1 Tax=Marinobacterium sp. MBR-109 TaxID=3156462 RepID=UPI0033952601
MTVKITKPQLNLREELAKASARVPYQEQEFYFTGDASTTTFTLQSGWMPKYVYLDGLKKRQGSADDFTVSFDGFSYSVVFAVAPGGAAEIDVIGVLA